MPEGDSKIGQQIKSPLQPAIDNHIIPSPHNHFHSEGQAAHAASRKGGLKGTARFLSRSEEVLPSERASGFKGPGNGTETIPHGDETTLGRASGLGAWGSSPIERSSVR